MLTDELTRLMHENDVIGPGPDLERVRTLGRRRRRHRRGAVAAVAAALVVAVGGSVLVNTGAEQTVRPAGRGSTLSSYERMVLREVPGSYAVGGVVVVPGAVDPTSPDFRGPDQVGRPYGDLVPLGFDVPVGGGFLPTKQVYPAGVEDSKHFFADVAVDPGPTSLACLKKVAEAPCALAAMATLPDGTPYYLFAYTTDDTFLAPSAGIGVFAGADVSDRKVARPTVVGGFSGTLANLVELTLADGTTAEAQVDRGSLMPGDTIFWARTTSKVVRVTTYDEQGALLDSTKVPTD